MSTPPDSTLPLPAALLAILRRRSACFIATRMPDGSPQLTQTWVDTDGTHVLVNTVQGHQKLRNVTRDPRVALNITDPEDTFRYFAVRGRVVEITTDGAAEHIEALAHRYLGGPYPSYSGAGEVRVILRIAAERLHGIGF